MRLFYCLLFAMNMRYVSTTCFGFYMHSVLSFLVYPAGTD